jgi:ParB family chromosome partitioning protein
VFWIETDKIKPNPFQPRREFDPEKLKDLSDSIRAYGVLQPLVVTRRELVKDEGGVAVEYELLAGERRLRASKLIGLPQVPVLIRTGADGDREKLEISIIENLQREDLNPVERARAFKRLVEEFGFKHADIGARVGKSRVYVSNTVRILDLPEEMLAALSTGHISEGHTRPLLMLSDRPDEQRVLFQEITIRKMTVREGELAARKIAVERARKRDDIDPELISIEKKLREALGTRVNIERKAQGEGGRIHIDFFSTEDLAGILQAFDNKEKRDPNELLKKHLARNPVPAVPSVVASAPPSPLPPTPTLTPDEDGDLYSVRTFTV